ncbi:MAG: N-acetyltransferase [Prevotella sp.]|jgi:predicted GNAT family acetyltransferase|nr:N-acetyltransferase [Prevotella sp.]
MEYNIKHNKAESRFETEVEGKLSLVDYRERDNVYLVTHTEVPKELEGRGIAAALTKTLLDHVRENGLKVRPICPYTKAYILRHPEYNDIVAGA